MAFAEGTTVSPDRSQQEIAKILKRYGANGFLFGQDRGYAVVAFRAHERQVRFAVSLVVDRQELSRTPTGKRRNADAVAQLADGEVRRRWRALALAIKAKLEVVETGIATFEEEFLAHIVLPDNTTVGEFLVPQIAQSYNSGTMPSLLPGVRPLELEA